MSEANTQPHGGPETKHALRAPRGEEFPRSFGGRILDLLKGKEELVTPERVVEALAALEQRLEPAMSVLNKTAPLEHFINGVGGFAHITDTSEARLVIQDGYATITRHYSPDADILDDTPRGRLVSARGSDPSYARLRDAPQQLCEPNLVFMQDGRVLYEQNFGDQRTQWQDISELSPRDAMRIVQATAAGIDHHLANP